MKKITLLLAAAGLVSGGAMAQTNVTIYGIVDTSIRYLSSDNAAGQKNFIVTNGAISNSRLGFKGSEDLGGGLKAIFRLESGFNSDTGGMSSPGVLFNRHSYVGLKGSFGQITVGRQQTPLFDLMADYFDPLTVGNYDQNAWMPAGATLVRNSNMLKYYGTFGGLAAGVSYAAGEQAGSVRRGSQIGGTLAYTAGPFAIGGGFQQTVSPTNSDWKDTAYNLSLSYTLGAAKLFGGYYRIKDSTGTTPAYFGVSNSVAAMNGGIGGVERKDNAYFLGATFQATPAWSLTAAGYYDKSKNVTVATLGNLGDGTRYALVGVAEYALSKRTQVYGTVDYNKAKNAALSELVGKDSVTGVAVGIRHIF
ncbi:porin [Collimonas antrihumi]|uniref:porin n=1 Tax=Collimonas antrihumi TaxID=1940615 RepID=UPI001B8C2134|nr:porin [Collimonas antrihumi]